MILLAGALAKAHDMNCAALAMLKLTHVEITRAELIGPGEFRVPTGDGFVTGANALMRSLPAFCRVTATARLTDDSEIKFEVWMPSQGWTSKLVALGNEGGLGAINYTGLATGIALDFSATSTDTSHEGENMNFAIGHSS